MIYAVLDTKLYGNSPWAGRRYSACRAAHRTTLESKDHHKTYNAAYSSSPAGKACRRTHHRRRKARKLNQLGYWPLPEREFLKLLLYVQDVRCFYCDRRLIESPESEHMIPLSRGGLHAADNVCLSCGPCNRRKHTKTVEEFMED